MCIVMQTPVPPDMLEDQLKVRAGFKFHRAPLAGPPGGLRAGGGGKGGGAEGRWGMGGPSGAPGGGNGLKVPSSTHEPNKAKITRQLRKPSERDISPSHTHIYIYIFVAGWGDGGPPGTPEARGRCVCRFIVFPQEEPPVDATHWVKKLWQQTIVENAEERWTSKTAIKACGSAP